MPKRCAELMPTDSDCDCGERQYQRVRRAALAPRPPETADPAKARYNERWGLPVGSCNCHHGSARFCPVHTQADYDAAQVETADAGALDEDGEGPDLRPAQAEWEALYDELRDTPRMTALAKHRPAIEAAIRRVIEESYDKHPCKAQPYRLKREYNPKYDMAHPITNARFIPETASSLWEARRY